jgi:RNA polymerase sigma-70 factor (ECF subfamily)
VVPGPGHCQLRGFGEHHRHEAERTEDAVTEVDQNTAWTGLAEEVRRYVRRRVADSHAAEDLAQDVFVKLARHLRDGTPKGPIHAWVLRVARNAVVDHYRAKPRDLPVAGDLPDAGRSPAAMAEVAPLLASFRECVHSLPAEQREAVLLAEYEGLTQQQIADRLGVALSTVKSRVQRGRKKLARSLADCCSFEFDRRGGLVDWRRRPGGGCREC